MRRIARVAFLADSFHEVNGAARTCRELTGFAKRQAYPFFSIRFARNESFASDGPVWTLELKRSPLSLRVDPDLWFDLAFCRFRRKLERRLNQFSPDIIHVMAPGELGVLGAIAAWRMRIPLVAAWHTNIHEYAVRRFPFGSWRIRSFVQEFVLRQILHLYRRGAVLLAPTRELTEMLQLRTGRPAFLMKRGVDCAAFSPEHRRRSDEKVVIGYVGRLMPEKGVRFFARLDLHLKRAGVRDYRIFIAGWGSEECWLRDHLPDAEFRGILDPEALGRAYADMDIFVFPSRTDTFGNVVQEALASGVPAVVTDSGGPRTIVEHGVTGAVASSDEEMCAQITNLILSPEERKKLGAAGRLSMLTRSWDDVFHGVYQAYAACLESASGPAK